MDGVDGGGGIVYDDDIKAQMQNAIDDILRLNGCDDGPLVPGATASSAAGASTSSPMGVFDPSSGFLKQNGGDQYNSSGSEMQVDLALNEAVNSIL